MKEKKNTTKFFKEVCYDTKETMRHGEMMGFLPRIVSKARSVGKVGRSVVE